VGTNSHAFVFLVANATPRPSANKYKHKVSYIVRNPLYPRMLAKSSLPYFSSMVGAKLGELLKPMMYRLVVVAHAQAGVDWRAAWGCRVCRSGVLLGCHELMKVEVWTEVVIGWVRLVDEHRPDPNLVIF